MNYILDIKLNVVNNVGFILKILEVKWLNVFANTSPIYAKSKHQNVEATFHTCIVQYLIST